MGPLTGALILAATAGCERGATAKGPAERAGAAVDETTRDVADAASQAAEGAADAAGRAADDVGEAIDKDDDD